MNHVQPEKRGIFYMGNGNELDDETIQRTKEDLSIQAKEQMERTMNAVEEREQKEYDEAANYNSNINDHLDMYNTFDPNESILIRFYRRLPRIINLGTSSIIVDETSHFDYAKMERTAATGSTYTQRQEPTEFKFLSKAIVVANGSYSDKYKAGDVVVTHQPIIKGVVYDKGEVQVFDGFFVHPDSGLVMPPQKPSPHYGYALVPISFIKGKNGTI